MQISLQLYLLNVNFNIDSTESKPKSKSKKKTVKKKKREKKEASKEIESASVRKQLPCLSVISISDCGSPEKELKPDDKPKEALKSLVELQRKSDEAKVVKKSLEFMKRLEEKEAKSKDSLNKARVSISRQELNKKELTKDTKRDTCSEITRKSTQIKMCKTSLIWEKEGQHKLIKP